MLTVAQPIKNALPLWNYSVRKCRLLETFLSQMYSVHIFITFLYKSNFNIIIPFTLLSKCFIPLRFSVISQNHFVIRERLNDCIVC